MEFEKITEKPSLYDNLEKKSTCEILKDINNEEKKVIALSAKMMKMNYMQSQEVKRDFVEKNMIFLGFIVVEKNKGSNKEVIL